MTGTNPATPFRALNRRHFALSLPELGGLGLEGSHPTDDFGDVNRYTARNFDNFP